jgi:HK97 family phage portal protein
MGIRDWIPGLKKPEAKAVTFDQALNDYFAMTKVKAGVPVNWTTALDVSTVLAVVRVLAEGVAQPPLRLMRETANGGSEPAVDHPLYKILSKKPNPWQTSFAMRETMMLHLALTGNAYFYKNIIRGKIAELIQIDPGHVTVTRNNDLSLTYGMTFPDGSHLTLPQEMVWHVRGPSWDTWTGMDAVRHARQAIGLTIATENTQAEMHANGLQAAGTYSTDQKIDAEKYKQIQAWIAAQIGGPNKHKPFIIDSGFEWKQQTMTGVDAQHLETRKLQIEEICRAFRVLPPMVGHSGQSMTFASAEQIFLAHVVHTLMPWCVRIEQSIDCDLLNQKGDEGVFAKFNMNALLRGAAKDRGDFYSKALGAGGSPAWMTQDEVRADDDLNPMGGEAAKLPKPTNVGGSPAGTPAKQEPKNDD